MTTDTKKGISNESTRNTARKKSKYSTESPPHLGAAAPKESSDKIPPVFITRSSTMNMVTLSVSLSGERCKKGPPPNIKIPPQRQRKSILLQQKELPVKTEKKTQVKKKISKERRNSRVANLQNKPNSSLGVKFQNSTPNARQNSSVKPKMVTVSRDILVRYFPEGVVKVKVDSGKGLTYAKVKHAAASALDIELTSLNFFGLYLGVLGDPREFCTDDALVPPDVTEVCLQRVILVSDTEERFYLSMDDHALGLIFWELKDQYDRGKMLGFPDEETNNVMERCLLAPHYGISLKKKFVELVLNLPMYYWSYFHKADFCILRGSIWPGVNARKKTLVHVVPDRERLVLLNTSGEKEILSIPWHKICSLTLKNSPIMLIEYEIMLVTGDHSLSRFISIATDRNKYLYTISMYMLRVLQSKDLGDQSLPPSDSYIKEAWATKTSTNNCVSDSEKLSSESNSSEHRFINKHCFRCPVYFNEKGLHSSWSKDEESSNDDEEDFVSDRSSYELLDGETSKSDSESIIYRFSEYSELHVPERLHKEEAELEEVEEEVEEELYQSSDMQESYQYTDDTDEFLDDLDTEFEEIIED